MLFLSALAGGAYILNKMSRTSYGNGIDDLLLYDSYEKSAVLQREFEDKLGSILYLLDEYKSEEYVESGGTINEQRLDNALRELYYGGSYTYTYTYNDGSEVTNGISITDTVPWERYGGEYDVYGFREQFKKDYAEKIEELKQAMIMDDLRSLESMQRELNRTKGFSYFATDGTYTVTNVGDGIKESSVGADLNLNTKLNPDPDPDPFLKAPAYLIYEGDDLTKVPTSAEGIGESFKYLDRSLEARLDNRYNPELTVYFSFDQSFLDAREAEFAEARNDIVRWIPLVVICSLLSLLMLVYLIITAGKKDKDGNYEIYRTDRIFTEIQLAIIAVLLIGGGALFGKFLYEAVGYGVSYNGSIYYVREPLYLSVALAAVVGILSASFGLHFILSVVRNIKAGRFLSNSLIFIVLHALWKGIRDFYLGGSLMKKVVLLTLAVCLLSGTIVLAPVMAALIIIFAPRWVKKFEEIKRGVEEVKNGNLAYKIKADGVSELDELARGINEISEASSIAIQNELKNQRLKTDLISNVSHDLKTPLTSIITYIDLLKQEGLGSTDAPKYLDILDQKSIRLKKLTEDLFDAAKASSGAIPVRFEKVEMLSLINQGLGEMNDRIEASNLEFRINAQNDKYYVRADGQLLWRVVENLLGNVLKYAQEGTRVYIDLREQNGKNGTIPNVILEIKNMSKTELNIEAEELMERFKRGDESRTTEGSGLGLAIAKDLVRLQNGWFEIKIDGDLFKAVVMLEAYTAAE